MREWKVIAVILLLSLLSGCTSMIGTPVKPADPAKINNPGDELEARQLADGQQEQESRLLINKPEQDNVGEAPPEERAVHENSPKPPKPRKPVKGIYVSGWAAGSSRGLDQLVKQVQKTDLNAMVIDVKNDFGQLTYDSKVEPVERLGTDRERPIKDIEALIKSLKAKDIYLIGRVVVFKDPLLAKLNSDWAIRHRTGQVWKDKKGVAWINPFKQEVWDYNIAIAEEAASLGFDEIQFDYVRFPDNGAAMDKVVAYTAKPDEAEAHATKAEVIKQFLMKAASAIHTKGARVSADVFGLVTSSKDDMGIGQTWGAIASVVDVISPMTYPSHYSPGMYGIRHPDLKPQQVIHHALSDAKQRNSQLVADGYHAADVRPWLQGFTANWVHPHQTYRAEQIRQQIRAAEQLGIEEFLIWNANCRYPYYS